MLIDFHTHAFPDAVAGRALAHLSQAGGALRPRTDGTVAGLTQALEQADALGVLLPVATNPLKLKSMNDWAKGHASPRIIPFGAAHPLAPDALEQLHYAKALGFQGVKLHPEYQNFQVDDPRAIRLYKEIGRLGLITVFHAGLDVAYMPPARCEPQALASVLKYFDGAPVVAAHMGGFLRWEEAFRHLCGLPLYLDTAYCHSCMVVPLAMKMIERHGADKILFGSDLPWSSAVDQRDMVLSWPLSQEEKDMILYGNARRLLGIE